MALNLSAFDKTKKKTTSTPTKSGSGLNLGAFGIKKSTSTSLAGSKASAGSTVKMASKDSKEAEVKKLLSDISNNNAKEPAKKTGLIGSALNFVKDKVGGTLSAIDKVLKEKTIVGKLDEKLKTKIAEIKREKEGRLFGQDGNAAPLPKDIDNGELNVLRPGPTQTLAALPKDEQFKTRFSKTEPEVITERARGKIAYQKAFAEPEVTESLTGNMLQSMVGIKPLDTAKERALKTISAPIQFIPGSLSNFLMRVGLESAGSDIVIDPTKTSEKNKLIPGTTINWQQVLIGSDPIKRLSEDSLTYRLTTEKLAKLGVPKEVAAKPAFAASILIGAIVENPFVAGFTGAGKKAAKEVLEKSMITILEEETGEKITKELAESIGKEADKIVKLETKQAREQMIKDFVKDTKAKNLEPLPKIEPVIKDTPEIKADYDGIKKEIEVKQAERESAIRNLQPTKQIDQEINNLKANLETKSQEYWDKEINSATKIDELPELAPLSREIQKYSNAKEFEKAYTMSNMMDLSDPEKHRFGRIFSDNGEGKIENLVDINKIYSKDIGAYPDAKVPRVLNPNKKVTIYRSAQESANEILPGDWVSFSKDYAESHNRGKLISVEVPAKDVVWAQGDFNEWVYSPSKIREKYKDLQDFYNKNIGGKEITPIKNTGLTEGDIVKYGNEDWEYVAQKGVTGQKALIRNSEGVEKVVYKTEIKNSSDDILTEATKYKTPEDFIKSQGTEVYHGTGEKFEKFGNDMRGSITGAQSAKGAIWFTDNPKVAKAHSIYAAESGPLNKMMREADELEKIAQKSGLEKDWLKHDELVRKIDDMGGYDETFARRSNANVKESVVTGDFYKVDAKGKTPQELSSEGDIDSWLNEQLDIAKKQNKDGVIFENLDDAVGLYDTPATHYAIFDAKNIKTKDELTTIWEKANKKTEDNFNPVKAKIKKEVTPDVVKKTIEADIAKGDIPEVPGVNPKIAELEKLEAETAMFPNTYDRLTPDQIKTKQQILALKRQITPEEFKAAKELKAKMLDEAVNGELGQKIASDIEVRIFEREQLNDKIAQGIKNNPYYVKEKGVKDIMGEGWLLKRGTGTKRVRYMVADETQVKKFLDAGYERVIAVDSLASEAGFDNGYEYLVNQLEISKLPRETKIKNIIHRELLKDKSYNAAIDTLESVKGEYVPRSSLLLEQAKTKIIEKRRGEVRSIRDYFKLTDNDLKAITQRDVKFMDQQEYSKFIDDLRSKATQFAETRQAKAELIDKIERMEFKKVENLQRAMKLPTIENMTPKQLKQFDEILSQYQHGDEFLSQRLLETVDRTDLVNVKTKREVMDFLSKKTGASPAELETIKASLLDRTLYDTALARRNPFYKLVVDEFAIRDLKTAKNVLEKKDILNKLVTAARKSRKRKLLDKLLPQDKVVFDYMGASGLRKDELLSKMTKEEIDLANFLKGEYERMRDILVENHGLTKIRENYVTHKQRGFLEALKDDGFKEAFREAFDNNKLQQEVFEIISDTGDILPLEKFFVNSMRRTGKAKPTKNIAAAYLGYLQNFEKKAALDSVIPEIMAYSKVLTKDVLTPRGLIKDDTLSTFMKEWINSKKGRNVKSFIRQGSNVDTVFSGLNSLITLTDLGLNIPVGVASKIGENMSNWVALGSKRVLLGKARRFTKEGKAILKKYVEFTGEDPIMEILFDASKNFKDKSMETAFSLFRRGSYTANKDFLLGSLTKVEFESGVIAPARLAEMRRLMGKFRALEGTASVFGKTTEGKIFTKYKTWAVPHLYSAIDNVGVLTKTIKREGFAKAAKSQAFGELFRQTVGTAALGLTAMAILNPNPNDKSFIGRLKTKIVSETLTSIAALNPTTWTTARMLSFFQDLGANLVSLAKLEAYKTSGDGYKKGDLKGIKKLERQFTPKFISQFTGAVAPKESTSGGSGGTKLPKLPKLNSDGGLPKLPKLPKL